MLLFATAFITFYLIMVYCNNVLDMVAITFLFEFSVAMYVFIIGFIINNVIYFFKKKDQKDLRICLVILLVFVSLSAAVFTTIKCVRSVTYLTTLLCVYQQDPILAIGDSSVISNYR